MMCPTWNSFYYFAKIKEKGKHTQRYCFHLECSNHWNDLCSQYQNQQIIKVLHFLIHGQVQWSMYV
jgi:hypothetical protein